ncbi:MAG: transposase DNA-binding-containing protein [Limnohabitans sp.]|nr:transposase DNA-binding-containing protein [Limnohabitans sp.]
MFTDEFGDKRIENRLNKLVEKLVNFRQSSINFISDNSSERRSFYRILQNTSVTESFLLTPITQSCVQFCAGKNIVVVNNTCEFNLTSHMGVLKKIVA